MEHPEKKGAVYATGEPQDSSSTRARDPAVVVQEAREGQAAEESRGTAPRKWRAVAVVAGCSVAAMLGWLLVGSQEVRGPQPGCEYKQERRDDRSETGSHGARLEGIKRATGGLVNATSGPRGIHGRVLDEGKRPIAAARVWLEEDTRLERVAGCRSNGPARPLASATCTEAGSFEFEPQHGGPYEVVADAPGFARSRMSGAHDGQQVDLTLLPGCDIIVQVLGPGGSPVPEARVRAYIGRSATREVLAGEADDLGQFLLPSVGQGSSVSIWATHPDFGSASVIAAVPRGRTQDSIAVRFPSGRVLVGSVRDAGTGKPVVGAALSCPTLEGVLAITDQHGHFSVHGWQGGPFPLRALVVTAEGYAGQVVNASECAEIEILLEGAAQVSVHVVSNRVGSPIANAKVYVRSPDFTPLPIANPLATTSAEGLACVTGLTGGKLYRVFVSAGGYGSREMELTARAAGGAPRTYTRIELGKGCTVRGRLTRHGSEPMTDAVVTLAPLHSISAPDTPMAPQYASAPPMGHSVETDAHGCYQVTGLAPGRHELTAQSLDRCWAGRAIIDVEPGLETIADVALVETGGQLEVLVQDESGTPVADVFVSVVGSRTCAVTNASGTCRLVRPIEVDANLKVWGKSFHVVPVDPRPVPVGVSCASITVAKSRMILCTVRDESGEPLSDVEVRVTASFLKSDELVCSDSHGRLRVAWRGGSSDFADLHLTGATVVCVNGRQERKPAGLLGNCRIRGIDALHPVELLATRAQDTSSLLVEVVSPDGAPCPQVRVSLLLGDSAFHAHTAADGLACFPSLRKAARFLVAARPRPTDASRRGWLASSPKEGSVGDVPQVVLQFVQAVRVQGHVDVDERPPHNSLQVYVSGATQRFLLPLTVEPSGRFDGWVPEEVFPITVTAVSIPDRDEVTVVVSREEVRGGDLAVPDPRQHR